MSSKWSPKEVPGGGRVAPIGLVLRSLAALGESRGVTPHSVYRHIAAQGNTRLTPGRLQLAMERAVRDGILIRETNHRYNINMEMADAVSDCGCGAGSKSKRRSVSKKKCKRHSRSKRRSASRRKCKSGSSRGSRRRRRSASSRRRRRSASSRRRCRRRRKPLCGQQSLYKRLMKLLFPRKRCVKRKKRQPYTWVRKHCRRNPSHGRFRRKGRGRR